LII
ncbi:hypothetical protein Anas_13054, partial [Armadillidium nasatum]|jgi:hypothetical protein